MAPNDMAPDSSGSADAGTAPVTPATPPAPPTPAATAAQPASPQRASLWQSVLQGALTGLAGSAGAKHFGGGLAGGAEGVLRQKQIDIENQRAAAAQAQSIKFQNAESAYKAAQLARQDQQLSILSDEQKDKHREIELKINEARQEYGDSVMPVDNSAEAATNHLVAGTAQAQAAGQNGVYVNPRTMAGVDAIHVVSSNDAPIDQGLQYYNKLANFLGVSPYNRSAWFAAGNPGREKLKSGLEGIITGKEQATGEFVTTERLPNSVAALSSYIKRAEGDPNTDKKILATAKATRDFQQKAIDDDQKRKLALAQGKQDIKDNSAPNTTKQQMADLKLKQAQETADEWRPGADSAAKNKARLGENVAVNTNEIASIIQRRPDLLGAVAGRFTQAEQMIGNNDPDINALGMAVQNLAKSNGGLHGMRSHENALHTEQTILNSFKSGPKAVSGALRVNMNSAQSFIDSARPDSYKTHSKNGGAIRVMLPTME